MVLELPYAVDRVIPCRSVRTRVPNILPQEWQAVNIYSSPALVKSFARIALNRAPTVGQRKKRCLQSPQ